jgi:DNA topoisomerase-1
MGYDLIITEKPSVAKKMADALADGKPIQKKEGQVSYYLVTYNKKDVVVCCAVGHLFTVAEKDAGGWNYPVFDVEWKQSALVSKGSAFTKKYADVIKKLAKDSESCTIATDYDIEGEVIGYNVMKYLCKRDDAHRMKFSAITKQDLIDSYQKKSKTLNWGQVHAGVTRHELDWFYGINLSRALSNSIKKAGRFKVLSSGRVQGPALKILCDKEREIRAFKPKDYWDLTLQTSAAGVSFDAGYEKNPVQDEKTAKTVYAKTSGKKAIVSSVDTKNKTQSPPNPFDLTSAQIEIYKLFGIQPKDGLAILQDLYINGYTSYPRTSSQKLPKELDYKKILTQLSRDPSYKNSAQQLLSKKKLTPNEGKKTDDAHPAIYPTGILPQNLEGRPFKVYDLIVKRFMATFGEPAIRQHVTAKIEIEKEVFVAKGARTIDSQWHALYAPYVKLDETELPPLKEGADIENKKISLEQKQTKPPKRYTPASIIKELEKRGLGTKATRAAIIDNLFDRGYVHEASITVTDIGLKTCDVLEKYCPEILDDNLTREIEDEMEDLRLEKKKPDEVKDHAIHFLTKTLKRFDSNIKEIGVGLLEATKETESFGTCPLCNEGRIVQRRGKFGRFLACSRYPDCTQTFKIPAKGKLSPVEQEEGKFLISVRLPKKGAEVVDLRAMQESKDEAPREKIPGEGGTCAVCGKGKMVLRKGFYGEFLGCNQYPKCKTIVQIPKN